MILHDEASALNESVDVNRDGKINVADIVFVVNNIIESAEQYAISLSSSTQYADVLIYNKDGSYILLNQGNDSGYGWIHLNSSLENDQENGATILIDAEGKPIMLTIPEGHFIFKKVTDDSFDFAYRSLTSLGVNWWNTPLWSITIMAAWSSCLASVLRPSGAGVDSDARYILYRPASPLCLNASRRSVGVCLRSRRMTTQKFVCEPRPERCATSASGRSV